MPCVKAQVLAQCVITVRVQGVRMLSILVVGKSVIVVVVKVIISVTVAMERVG